MWVERKVTHVPHPRHARVKHARFTHVLTDVPARIRHRTTRVSAILYDPRRPAYRCALHIHMTARRSSRCSTSPFGRCRRTGVHNFSSALNSALIDSACQAFRYQSAYGTRRHSRGTSFFEPAFYEEFKSGKMYRTREVICSNVGDIQSTNA